MATEAMLRGQLRERGLDVVPVSSGDDAHVRTEALLHNWNQANGIEQECIAIGVHYLRAASMADPAAAPFPPPELSALQHWINTAPDTCVTGAHFTGAVTLLVPHWSWFCVASHDCLRTVVSSLQRARVPLNRVRIVAIASHARRPDAVRDVIRTPWMRHVPVLYDPDSIIARSYDAWESGCCIVLSPKNVVLAILPVTSRGSELGYLLHAFFGHHNDWLLRQRDAVSLTAPASSKGKADVWCDDAADGNDERDQRGSDAWLRGHASESETKLQEHAWWQSTLGPCPDALTTLSERVKACVRDDTALCCPSDMVYHVETQTVWIADTGHKRCVVVQVDSLLDPSVKGSYEGHVLHMIGGTAPPPSLPQGGDSLPVSHWPATFEEPISLSWSPDLHAFVCCDAEANVMHCIALNVERYPLCVIDDVKCVVGKRGALPKSADLRGGAVGTEQAIHRPMGACDVGNGVVFCTQGTHQLWRWDATGSTVARAMSGDGTPVSLDGSTLATACWDHPSRIHGIPGWGYVVVEAMAVRFVHGGGASVTRFPPHWDACSIQPVAVTHVTDATQVCVLVAQGSHIGVFRCFYHQGEDVVDDSNGDEATLGVQYVTSIDCGDDNVPTALTCVPLTHEHRQQWCILWCDAPTNQLMRFVWQVEDGAHVGVQPQQPPQQQVQHDVVSLNGIHIPPIFADDALVDRDSSALVEIRVEAEHIAFTCDRSDGEAVDCTLNLQPLVPGVSRGSLSLSIEAPPGYALCPDVSQWQLRRDMFTPMWWHACTHGRLQRGASPTGARLVVPVWSVPDVAFSNVLFVEVAAYVAKVTGGSGDDITLGPMRALPMFIGLSIAVVDMDDEEEVQRVPNDAGQCDMHLTACVSITIEHLQ